MAYKGYSNRFPVRKLNRKAVFKKRKLCQVPQPRTAGRGSKGISRKSYGK
ncbi:hypothetical protein HQ584_02225 [Patescibacteria group bacterium]|nr:hypothetical protein [Patescibacteria group bacterium]